jgi:hypothetical protein
MSYIIVGSVKFHILLVLATCLLRVVWHFELELVGEVSGPRSTAFVFHSGLDASHELQQCHEVEWWLAALCSTTSSNTTATWYSGAAMRRSPGLRTGVVGSGREWSGVVPEPKPRGSNGPSLDRGPSLERA